MAYYSIFFTLIISNVYTYLPTKKELPNVFFRYKVVYIDLQLERADSFYEYARERIFQSTN